MSDIRMTYEYIRVTYEWHTSTYEWYTSGMTEGKPEIQKFKYLQNDKNILEEVKSIFENYLSATIYLIKEK